MTAGRTIFTFTKKDMHISLQFAQVAIVEAAHLLRSGAGSLKRHVNSEPVDFSQKASHPTQAIRTLREYTFT